MRNLLLLLLLLPLAACGSAGPGSSDGASDPGPTTALPTGELVTESLPAPFGPTDRARVSFGDGQVSFSATCNTMSGSARVVDGVLEVGQVGGTEMGCPGPGHEQDQWLVDFFTGGPSVEILDTGLTLTSGGTTLRLLPPDAAPDPGPAAPLEGTRWRLSGIEETEGDTVSMRPVGRVRAVLGIERGAVTFTTGCNGGGGDVTVEDGVLRLSEVITTLRACEDERGEVERAVMAVLGRDRVTWSVAGDRLRLSAGDVALLYDAR